MDRLAYVGSRGMGALVYRPEIKSEKTADLVTELDILAAEMNHILQGSSSEIIEELFILGGSSGGARLKIFAAYNPTTDNLIHGADNVLEGYEKVFRLAAFNVYSHNRDDHSKNFSFRMNAKREWQFAPAYDLTFSYSAYGFHSTMVAGESKNPGRAELMKLATHFGLKNAGSIIEEVQEAISQWREIASEYGITKETKNTIHSAMDEIRD